MKEILKRLEEFKSSSEASQYLTSLNLTCAELKLICEYYSIPVQGRKSELIEHIVEGVAGSKIRFSALLNIKL